MEELWKYADYWKTYWNGWLTGYRWAKRLYIKDGAGTPDRVRRAIQKPVELLQLCKDILGAKNLLRVRELLEDVKPVDPAWLSLLERAERAQEDKQYHDDPMILAEV